LGTVCEGGKNGPYVRVKKKNPHDRGIEVSAKKESVSAWRRESRGGGKAALCNEVGEAESYGYSIKKGKNH